MYTVGQVLSKKGGQVATISPQATVYAALELMAKNNIGALVESFARHLMLHVDAWRELGFAAVAKSYLPRLEPEKGARRDIDDNGDLLVRRMGKADVKRQRLIPALAKPTWLDPETRGPR